MVFHWSLSDSKILQVYRTLLSILAVLNNAVVWMVSTSPPTSKSSSPFSNPLVTVPNAPITIGIIVTYMFHSFFNSLARSRYLSFFSHSFSFILWSAGTAKSIILQILWSSGWLMVSSLSPQSLHLLFCWVIIIIYSFRVFPISFSWWFFTGVWVTTSLLNFPAFFSVFWLFSIMLSFGWSPLVRQLPSPPGPLIIL